MSISLAHCITQKNHFFTCAQLLRSRSPVLVHGHVHSIDLLSHCITQEIHLDFLVNSFSQRRIIHHLHFCSHDNAPSTLRFHTFTLCSTTSTSNSVDHLSHYITQENHLSSSQLSEWRRSYLHSSSVSDRNHTPFLGAFSRVCNLENVSHSCDGQHLSGL
jgi:hypothetical protein